MGLIHRVADTHRSHRKAHRDAAAVQADVRWRRRAMLIDVDRDLEELADEQAYIETEIARSRDHTARLDSDAAAAAADGCAAVARELREKLIQTHAFLAELAEVRQAVTTRRDRLLDLRKRLTDGPAPSGSSAPGPSTPDATAVKTATTATEDKAPSRRSS